MIGADTIFALSSAAGKAGVAVIRVSGPMAGAAVDQLCGMRPAARVAHYSRLRDPGTGEVYDRGVVLWFPGPNSATGEDVAEFQVHGSRAVVEGLFGALGRLENTRPAMAGEFLRRAFQAGKADLVEIEGLADLLNAETAAQRRLALRQATGLASATFESWREQLLGLLAHVEALVDFGDEDDVARLRTSGVVEKIQMLAGTMSEELVRASASKVVRQGLKVVLSGVPNTGKSSLLNALARRDAAIVSARPGTTRDVVEVPLDIDGLLVTLTDTAGLRVSTDDEIEEIGIERSEREMRAADLRIWVWAEDVPGSADYEAAANAEIVVRNKSDAIRNLGLIRNESIGVASLDVSARTGEGLEALMKEIAAQLRGKYGQGESALIVRERQTSAVQDSIRYLNEGCAHMGGPLEVIAEDLRLAARALARLTGRIDVEDLLSAIFGEFCIGK